MDRRAGPWPVSGGIGRFDIVTDPSVGYIESWWVSGTLGTLAFPANSASTRQYMEVNFLIASDPSPEPASFALAGLGLGGVWLALKRQQT